MEALLKYRNTRGHSHTNRNTDKSFSIDKDKKNARPPHTMIQPKLELTTPGDSYEQEADRIADFVMRKAFSGDNGMPQEHTSRTSALPPVISRQTEGFSSGLTIDPATESGINASRGGGQPLPDALRAKMESGFGTDFSGVRLHTDSQAADLSSSLQAKAFTHGNDIFFNSGQYNAQSATGQHLIAHELTHVAQQSGKVGRVPIDPPDGYFEMWAKSIQDVDNEKKNKKEKLAEAERLMKNFIIEPTWVKEKVLGEDLFQKLQLNYLIKEGEEKRPIVIVVLTSHYAACHGDVRSDKACAFEEVSPGRIWGTNIEGPITSLLENLTNERLLMIQAPTNDSDLKNKIQEISRLYGPIKDVVFRGHGNRNFITLNKFGVENELHQVSQPILDSYRITTANSSSLNNTDSLISTIVQEMYKDERYSVPHSIIYAGCLTDSDAEISFGLSENTRYHLKTYHPSSNINVQGNESSVDTEDVILDCNNGENLILKNKNDPSAPKSNGEPRDYVGCDAKGVLRNMIGKLNPNTRGSYSNPDSFEYCSYWLVDSIEDLSIEKRNIEIIIRTRRLIDIVKYELEHHHERKDKLLEFLQKLDKKDKSLFNPNILNKNKTSSIKKNGKTIKRIEVGNVWDLYYDVMRLR